MELKADKVDKNLYRKSTIGEALNSCLIDLKERQEINDDTKKQIELEFDNVYSWPANPEGIWEPGEKSVTTKALY